jgi:hypothetical protein
MFGLRLMVCSLPLCVTAAVLACACPAIGDEVQGVGRFNPSDETVELFSGIQDGQLEARLIVKSSKQGRVFVTNKSDKPLNVAMPAALAGVPVLAQFLPPLNANGGNQNNNGAQRVGMGNQFGNDPGNNPFGGQFFNPGGGGNNMLAPFNIAPEKVGALKLTAVCLEHGRPEPRARMAYELKPFESVTDKRGVIELCEMLGRGEVSQRAAQAAAWHLNNDMSWDALRAKRLKSVFGPLSKPFFSRQELSEAEQAAQRAVELAREKRELRKPESLAGR